MTITKTTLALGALGLILTVAGVFSKDIDAVALGIATLLFAGYRQYHNL